MMQFKWYSVTIILILFHLSPSLSDVENDESVRLRIRRGGSTFPGMRGKKNVDFDEVMSYYHPRRILPIETLRSRERSNEVYPETPKRFVGLRGKKQPKDGDLMRGQHLSFFAMRGK